MDCARQRARQLEGNCVHDGGRRGLGGKVMPNKVTMEGRSGKAVLKGGRQGLRRRCILLGSDGALQIYPGRQSDETRLQPVT